MTVTQEPPVSGPYEADGTSRLFDFTFRADELAHLYLRVVPTDGDAFFVYSGFTAEGLGDHGGTPGGVLTYPISPADPLEEGTLLTIYRNVPYDQPAQIGNQGRFFPQTHETAFDYLEMQIQQLAAGINPLLAYDVLERAVLPVYCPGTKITGQVLFEFIIPVSVVLRLEGSVFARVRTAGVGATELLIQKNGEDVGTVDWDAAENIGAGTVSEAVLFSPGDRLAVLGGATVNGTAANYSLTFLLFKNA